MIKSLFLAIALLSFGIGLALPSAADAAGARIDGNGEP